MLEKILQDTAAAFDTALAQTTPVMQLREIGTVTHVSGGIARISGLPGITSEELVEFPGGLLGIAVNLEPQGVGVVLLGDSGALSAGDEVKATGRLTDTPVGSALLGRVVDATGRVLDDKGPLQISERRSVENAAPAIINRAPVSIPLQTGLKVIDSIIPIGRGQRELILGDRQTGKTTVAIDTILNQQDKNVICIYCAIGQRGTAVAQVVDTLTHYRAMDYTIVVVAAGEDPPGLQYVTPYAATTMAEYFMLQGRDVLIVYDDLTRHARAYRELSLLLRRPPGREAYPGDIFYIHSRLLERATHLRPESGGGSLTALPIIETQAQDISAYIPTNLISITDGQIYLSPDLFRKGLMPAVDVGKSVSRVGGKAQFPAFRAVAGDLKLSYAQFEDLETFARFATRLDDATRAAIERGRRVREVLKQPEHHPLNAAVQIAILKAVNSGLMDDLALEKIAAVEQSIEKRIADDMPGLYTSIVSGDKLMEADWENLLTVLNNTISDFKKRE